MCKTQNLKDSRNLCNSWKSCSDNTNDHTESIRHKHLHMYVDIQERGGQGGNCGWYLSFESSGE